MKAIPHHLPPKTPNQTPQLKVKGKKDIVHMQAQ